MLKPEKLKFKVNCEQITALYGEEGSNDDPLQELGVDSQYFDMDKFFKIKPDQTSSFSMLNLNIASLSKHIDDLRLTHSPLLVRPVIGLFLSV